MPKRENRDPQLPPVEDGEQACILKVDLISKKTRPPDYYTEGTLIADMEGAAKYVEDQALRKHLRSVSGLGTSATRAAIIEGLKRRGLLEVRGKHLRPTPSGMNLVAKVPPSLVDVALTAQWEAELDAIAEGKRPARAFLESIVEATVQRTAELKAIHDSNPPPPSRGKKSGKPTDKMKAYARKLANLKGVKLPRKTLQEFEACRAFIDEHSGPLPPTDKALAFAEKISARTSNPIPEDCLKDGWALSRWIDSNK